MYQLTPGETYPLHKVLSDPLNADTAYVRATVRNAIDNATIAVLPMEDLGSRRFRYIYDVPGGYQYIVIDFKVYTDSGYSSLDPNEPIESREYVIEERYKPGRAGGGGGGGIRPSDIRDAVQQVLEASPMWAAIARQFATIEGLVRKIKMPDLSLEEVREGLEELGTAIGRLPKPASLEGISSAIADVLSTVEDVGAAVAAIEIPKPEPQKPVDLKPVLEAIGATEEKLAKDIAEVKEEVNNPKQLTLSLGTMKPPAEDKKEKPPMSPERARSLGKTA